MREAYQNDILLDVVYDGTYNTLSMKGSLNKKAGMYMGYTEDEINSNAIHANEEATKYSQDLGDSALYEANRQLREELSEYKRKYKAKSQQRDYWYGQTKTTEGRRAREDSARRMAREMLKEIMVQ